MSSISVFVLLFVLLALKGSGGAVELRHNRRPDLNPQAPRVELESEGGKLEVWGGKGSGVFEDANVAACRTTLKSRGLWLPSYVDSPGLQVVTRGSGRLGIISPFGDRQENSFKVEKGDVVAVPDGHVVWWYNDGDKDLEIVGAADVTQSPRPAGLRAFHLAGGKDDRRTKDDERKQQDGYGAIIHGFSSQVLSRAWEMDESHVHQLLEGQSEVGIVRVDKGISFQGQDNVFFQNFIYRLGKAHADLRVENGGELRELNSYKLPILKYLGLGLECMELNRGAMVAPNWFQDAHQMLYVVEGRGSIEIVYDNGLKALKTDLEEGSLVVIPAFHPSTKIASDDQRFHYITFVTSDRPVISYLCGRNSVYRGIPLPVLSRMLKVKEDKAKQIQEAHGKESVILAAADDQPGDSQHDRKTRDEDRRQHDRKREDHGRMQEDDQAMVWAL